MLKRIYTIGYGNQKPDVFFGKLLELKINTLIDLRSKPFSRWQGWTNSPVLKKALSNHGIEYKNIKKLGGMPLFSDETIAFELEKLKELEGNVVVMCSEGNPNSCHRKTDIARVGETIGFEFEHILLNEKLIAKRKGENLTLI